MEKDPKSKKGKKDKTAKGDVPAEPVEEGMDEKPVEVVDSLPVDESEVERSTLSCEDQHLSFVQDDSGTV